MERDKWMISKFIRYIYPSKQKKRKGKNKTKKQKQRHQLQKIIKRTKIHF